MNIEINNDLDCATLAFDHRQRGFVLYRDLKTTSTKEWLVRDLLGCGEASAVYGVPGSGKSVSRVLPAKVS